MEEKEMIHISQASKELGITEQSLIKSIREKKGIEAKLLDGQYFIDYVELKRLKRNRRLGVGYDVVIPKGFITASEAEVKYNINRQSLTRLMNGRSLIKIGVLKAWDETEVSKCILQQEELKKIKEGQYGQYIGLRKIPGSAREKVTSLIRDNVISDSNIKIIYEGKRKNVFVERNFLELINNNEIDSNYLEDRNKRRLTRFDIDVTVRDMYDLHEVEKAVDSCISKSIKVDGKERYTLEEINDVFGNDMIKIEYMLKSNDLKDHIEVRDEDFNKHIIFGSGVKKYLRINGYISAQEISCIIGQAPNVLIRPIGRMLKKYDLEPLYYQDCMYVKKEIALEGLKDYLRNKALWEESLEEVLILRLRLMDTPFSGTLNLVKKFLKNELERLKSTTVYSEKAEFGRSLNGVDILLDRINKEIYMYDNSEIENLLLELAIDGIANKKISKFINYVRKEIGERCNYTKQSGQSFISQLVESNNIVEDKIYSKEVWCRYYQYLRDIDLHIIKAFKDERYAQIWLYCLLHLSITWRSKDIIDKIPNIPLEIIEIFDFDWFKAGNNFTLSMALMTLEQVRFSLDGIIAYKNKMNLHFNVPISLKIATAIALIINEIHRRKNNQESIFFKLRVQLPSKKNDYERFFLDEPSLVDFSNIKATITLMTYNFSTAVSTVGMAGAAYQLNSYGRSHKEDQDRITNTTGMYLHLKNVDGGPTDVAYQTIERGAMGFLYIKILECCMLKEELSLLTQEELTDIINDMRQEVSPLTLENLASNLLNNRQNVSLGLNVISFFQKTKTVCTDSVEELSKEFEKKIMKRYMEIAYEVFPNQREALERFIQEKHKEVNEIISKDVGTSENAFRILSDILNGQRSCFTDYSDCLFNELERKEKCPYGKPETCIGCKYNLPTISQLYELNQRLSQILDEMIEDLSLTEIELVKNTSIVMNYLGILVQAKAQYESLDQDILTAFLNVSEINSKINNLQKQGKMLFIDNDFSGD